MNEINRNTRTLIVSFVVAIMVLTPLRFVEVGQMVGEAQVLGETDVRVVLPVAEVEMLESGLEAPYAEIEAGALLGEETVLEKDCISRSESELMVSELKQQIEGNDLSGEQLNEIVNQLIVVEESTCK